MNILSGDLIYLPGPDGLWVAHNPSTHSCLGLDDNSLTLLRELEVSSAEDVVAHRAGEIFHIWEIETFPFTKGLLADPTPFTRDGKSWSAAEDVNARALINCFEKHFLYALDRTEYLSRFAAKTSLIDRKHFGNFHEQLGQKLLLKDRQSPEAWWVRQKFKPDLSELEDNPYKWVQGNFLETYFKCLIHPGMKVLDVGCGVGFYSRMMAECGALVTGVDPNPNYIVTAQSMALDGAQFYVRDVGIKSVLTEADLGTFDLVFMSDALLFYFHPPSNNTDHSLNVLLSDIRAALTPTGRYVSMEPHFLFWTKPWLGAVDRPFTILTEYANKNFAVTPTICELIQAWTENGFVIDGCEELYPAAEALDQSPRAYRFASEFPLWQVFELRTQK